MRNVVLVCLDSVRTDFFDEFAHRIREQADTVYTQCRAASGWSLPSHASMFSGELPHLHGVHTHARDFTRIDRNESFVGELPEHTSIGVSANMYAGRNYGFDSFFDSFTEIAHTSEFQFERALSPKHLDRSDLGYSAYVRLALQDSRPIRSLANGVLLRINPFDVLFSGRPWPELRDKGTADVLSEAKAQIVAEERPARPVFAFLNVMDAHVPMYHHQGLNRELHSVPNAWTSKGGPTAKEVSHNTETYRKYLENYRQLYAASIDYLDRLVAAWVDELRRETENQTTVIITADHGENLGFEADEFLFDHHTSLSEAILHVPLVLIDPPDDYPELVSRRVSHLELGDLVVALARDTPFRFDDEPVTAEVIGHTGENPGGAYWDRAIRCVYDGSTKTIWDSLGTCKQFDLTADSSDTQRLIDTNTNGFPTADTTRFEMSILDAKRTAIEREIHADARTLDETAKRRLEGLGYM